MNNKFRERDKKKNRKNLRSRSMRDDKHDGYMYIYERHEYISYEISFDASQTDASLD